MIVYTYGVFDLLHVGHLKLLREARALGGYLIVGVFTDAVAEGFKRRPIIPFEQRLELIRSLDIVNEAYGQFELSPDKNIQEYKPDILAKGPGAGWGEMSSFLSSSSETEEEKIPGQDLMQERGGKIVRLQYHTGQSTSAIIDLIKSV